MSRNTKTYIFYGLGTNFWSRLEKRKEILDYVMAFMDSDSETWGRHYFDIEVLPPDKVKEIDYEKIVITSNAYFNEIKKDLMEKYSVNEERIQYIEEFIAERVMNADFLPDRVRLEACSTCQLDCRACYMRANNYGGVGNGYLKYENFKNFVDSNPQIQRIELSNNGEIFLNPDIQKIIEYAWLKGILLTAWNGVNLNNVSDEVLETLVRCEFRGMVVSLDGTKQDTYAYYRRNGNYDKVIENIKRINYYKYRYNKKLPELKWQLVVMNHNELEVQKAKFLAYELDMGICFKQTWESGFVPEHPDMLLRETGIDFRRKDAVDEFYDPVIFGNYVCRQMYWEPQINWDGRLLGCCANFRYDFGINVFEVGLKEALRDSKYMAAKKMLMNQCADGVDIADIPCSKCEYFDAIRKCGNYICAGDIVIY